MLLNWTAILYNDDPIVLVLTEAAFLLVAATAMFQGNNQYAMIRKLHGLGLLTQRRMRVRIADDER